MPYQSLFRTILLNFISPYSLALFIVLNFQFMPYLSLFRKILLNFISPCSLAQFIVLNFQFTPYLSLFRWAKAVARWTPDGKRSRGRQKIRWRQEIEDKAIAPFWRRAQNRDQWKKLRKSLLNA